MKIRKSELYKLIQESIENGIYCCLTERNDNVINHVKNNVINHLRARINGTIPTNNYDNYIKDMLNETDDIDTIINQLFGEFSKDI